MTYKKLKKAAHDFAQKHNVNYTLALKAVDEPLHELRDLTINHRGETAFCLRGDAHAHSLFAPYDHQATTLEPEDFYDEIMEAQGFSSLKTHELMVAFAQRSNLIHEANVDNIWDYRQLHRAGLLPEGSPDLEPLFHHFVNRPHNSANDLFSLLSVRLGVFSVLATPRTLMSVHFPQVMKVTIDELKALESGRPSGLIQAFEPIRMGDIHEFIYLANSVDGIVALFSPKLLEKDDFIELGLGHYFFSLKKVDEICRLEPRGDHDASLCYSDGQIMAYPIKPQNAIFL